MLEIKMILNKINYSIPYDYYNRLHGYVTQLLGGDTYHQGVNRFIYTNLLGGENLKDGIFFNNNPYFIIRIDNNDNEIKKRFLDNIGECTDLFNGLKVIGVSWDNINIDNKKRFRTVKQSPILVSKKYSWVNYLTNEEIKECEDYLLDSVKNKAKICNFKLDDNLVIKIVKQHNFKNIQYKEVVNKGRVFEFEINCNNETKKFIMMNGMGRSCGCGFGFIN